MVSRRQPTPDEWAALRFAWRVCAHVKSNSVVFANAERTLAIGAGQMSRVDAVNVAVMTVRGSKQQLAGSVAATDGFFPFRDGLDAVANAGASAVIHPGGSVRDEEVIAAADEHGSRWFLQAGVISDTDGFRLQASASRAREEITFNAEDAESAEQDLKQFLRAPR